MIESFHCVSAQERFIYKSREASHFSVICTPNTGHPVLGVYIIIPRYRKAVVSSTHTAENHDFISSDQGSRSSSNRRLLAFAVSISES